MTSVVGVHGVGNYASGVMPMVAAGSLATEWRSWLVSGLPAGLIHGVDVRCAYYAHLLREPGRQAGPSGLDGLAPDEEELMRAWLDQWNLGPGTAHGLPGTPPLRQALGWFADRFGFSRRAVELFVEMFFREVARYFREPGSARHGARAAVADEIARADRPRIVLAHSLGSVVAYEALHEYPHLEVDLFVTLGSPLALPYAVFPRLTPAPIDGLGARPPGVRRWANIADRGDFVAIPRWGVRDRFSVDDDWETHIHWADFHLAANYVRTAELAALLRPVLGAG